MFEVLQQQDGAQFHLCAV